MIQNKIRPLASMNYPNSFVVIVLTLIFLSPSVVCAQNSEQSSAFRELMTQAETLKKANLSGEALESVNQALKKTSTREQKMEALLFKGELLRATQQFRKALETLWKMKSLAFTPKERIWEIRMLGRLAAVHQELGEYPIEKIEDSMRHYIGAALNLAKQDSKKYEFEIASLYNELGLFIYRKGNTPEARNYYSIACSIFERLGEDQHLVTPLSNLLELESCSGDKSVADTLAKKLELLIEGRQWYTQMMAAYYALMVRAGTQNDTILKLNYQTKYLETIIKYNQEINSDKMLALSEIYERDKLKQEVVNEKVKGEENAQELKDANEFRNRLLLYLILMLGAGIGIVLLFFRERRIKQKINAINTELNQANDRYQLLVVESNHRIKNNLQMITAMLEYTGKGIDPSNNKVLNSISGKINTISALHKYLYVDIHNEFIPVATYFNELIKLYEGISPDKFSVSMDVGNVQIRSERIVYFGLIFNEMLSNTLEHSPDTIDQIQLCIEECAGAYRFIYRDNSLRLTGSKDGTGSELIRNLVIRVGGKNFELDPKTGMYEFYFSSDLSSATAP